MRGATPKLNSALDVDAKVSTATLGARNHGPTEKVLKDFTDEFTKKQDALRAQAKQANGDTTANAAPNDKTSAAHAKDPKPEDFEDLGHQQFATYLAQKTGAGRVSSSADSHANNAKHTRDFFRERQGESNLHSVDGLKRYKERFDHSANAKNSLGAGIDGGAQGVQGAIAAAGTAGDKTLGGGYDADQAKLAGKQDEVQVSLAQQVADAAKSNKDRSLKQISDNLDALKEVAARYASVIDKLT